MIYDVIAYIIVLIALGALVRNMLRFFNLFVKKHANTSKCRGCSSGCDIKEIASLKQPQSAHRDQYKFYL